MGIIQQASGAFTGTSFTPTLPAASTAANTVAIVVAANTTITTPTNWSARASSVNEMGHYLIDRSGTSLTSVTVACPSGQGTWWIVELNGVHDISNATNNVAPATTYTTPSIVPTAGTRTVLASLASTTSGAVVRTVSGFTNGFVKQIDVCQPTVDYPQQAGAAVQDVTADGVAGYSTTGTYSASSDRSGLIGAYVSSAGAAVARNRRIGKRTW